MISGMDDNVCYVQQVNQVLSTLKFRPRDQNNWTSILSTLNIRITISGTILSHLFSIFRHYINTSSEIILHNSSKSTRSERNLFMALSRCFTDTPLLLVVWSHFNDLRTRLKFG